MKSPIKKLFFLILLAFFLFRAEAVLAFAWGETVTFNINPAYDYQERKEIKATLRQVGDRALYYVEDDWWHSLGDQDATNKNLLDLLAEFDKTIYPRLTQVYGSEWSPGIDQEFRITILISHLKDGVGGYFNAVDEYTKKQLPLSNEREMLYFNGLYLASTRAKGFLAHEFQHLISYYQKEKLYNRVEDVWLNEARSEYAGTLCGFDSVYKGSNLEKRVKEFLADPTDSLTEWQNKLEDYGAINLFMQYLVGRYGEQFLSKMTRSEFIGIESINQALARLGYRERFSDIFTNWTIANYINDCQLGEGQKYCYLNSVLTSDRLRFNPTISNILAVSPGASFSFADQIKDWSGRWYEIWPMGSGLNLFLEFNGGQATNFQAPILIFYANGNKEIRFLKLNSLQAGSEIILSFGSEVTGVILIPSNQTKTSGFSSSEPTYSFRYSAQTTDLRQPLSPTPTILPSPIPTPANPAPAVNPNYLDGTLIRAKGDYRVYVIKGQNKRWLQRPEVLTVYPHLGWQSIIEVTPAERDYYQDVWLIRAEGDFKVYEINGDFSKHWLNISAGQFTSSGRQWDMVFTVNQAEKDLYTTGAEALR